MSYIGDFILGDTFDTKFCTVGTNGAPTTLAGTPVISAYVGNNIVELTAGITLTVDFDAVTGLHNVRVVASGGNGYATASNYQLVLTAGTVGGTSVRGYVIAEFSVGARSVVSVTGNVGGSVGSIAAAGIAANSLATAAKNDIADFVLDRNMATGTDSGTDSTAVRTPRQGLRVLRNKTTIAASVATVTKEDDITASWTASVTTAAGNPISGVDPT